MPRAGVEIGTHAVLEIDRFADIDNFPRYVFHNIAARFFGEGGEGLLKRLRGGHGEYFNTKYRDARFISQFLTRIYANM